MHFWLGHSLQNLYEFDRALASYEKVVSLDPLWTRTQTIPELAASMGDRERANALDRTIAAAASETWQQQAAAARIARRGGDLPFSVLDDDNSQSLWGQLTSPWIVPRLLVANGRGAELLTAFERDFASVEIPLEPAGIMSDGSAMAATPYVVLAMQEAGRSEDAEALRTRALGILTPGHTDDYKVMELILAARLESVAEVGLENRDAALGWIERARAYGYPHNMSVHTNDAIMPLASDPAFAQIADEPRFLEVAQAVETERAKERAEALALE